MHQHFWKRWNLEFLHTLQQRSKWTDPSTPIKVGSVVLIKDDSSPPLHWRVGRVLETHPGSDNVVRVVTLKTALGTLKRPVAGDTLNQMINVAFGWTFQASCLGDDIPDMFVEFFQVTCFRSIFAYEVWLLNNRTDAASVSRQV
ncbi:hypothetical protein NQ318_006500 [Aromia moschata]|uniref:DUF5641 domain-containing protein n=1 Tax=Aromia moschata TaxID=1265417 RepID=A0AAV8YQK6_9CUCU|nr:hypothetical protein NQ318_006500 [Aromia moschata]